MARMIPQTLSTTTRSYAEKKMFAILEKELDDDYVVFHSAWWQAVKYVIEDREGDFIIVHPQRGILILEVKGGNISYDSMNKSWYQNQFIMKKSPFEQVREIRHAFINFLKKCSNLSTVCVGQCVAFPDIDAVENGLPSESPRNILLLRPQLEDINRHISSIFDYYSANGNHLRLGEEGINRIIDLISPKTHFKKYIGNDLSEIHQEILRLTEQQFEILNSLCLQSQCTILGCAGSGKTQLAIEKARQLSQHKYTTLITCKSLNLSLYIADSLSQEIQSNYCVVSHYDGVIESYTSRKFDAVILDEGQDFERNELDVLKKLLTDEEIFYMFQDSNQNISKNISKYILQLIPTVLDKNCRNTKKIFKYAEPFVSCLHNIKSSSIDGRDVVQKIYDSPSNLLAMIEKDISFLVNEEKVNPKQIIILTDMYPLPKSVLASLSKIGQFALRQYSPINKERQSILWENIGRYKGLENDIILLIFEKPKTLVPNNWDIANKYIGATRAKSYLIVYESPDPEIDF